MMAEELETAKEFQSCLGGFQGKKVLITGGSDGIGAVTARMFLKHGAEVFVADIKPPLPSEHSERLHYIQCDAGISDQVSEAAARVEGEGGCDVLVNNVAIQPEAPCHEMSLEVWNRTLAVNLTSYFLFSQACIQQMLKHKRGGVIVNVASVQGSQSQPGIPGYAASKGAVLSLTRQLAVEYGAHNIRVNAVSPGTTATPLIKTILATRGTTEQEAGQSTCLGRIGQPEEIAQAICFLASKDAAFITGENLTVDGGAMAIGNWANVA